MPIDWFTFKTDVEKEGRNLNTAMRDVFLSTTEVDVEEKFSFFLYEDRTHIQVSPNYLFFYGKRETIMHALKPAIEPPKVSLGRIERACG